MVWYPVMGLGLSALDGMRPTPDSVPCWPYYTEWMLQVAAAQVIGNMPAASLVVWYPVMGLGLSALDGIWYPVMGLGLSALDGMRPTPDSVPCWPCWTEWMLQVAAAQVIGNMPAASLVVYTALGPRLLHP